MQALALALVLFVQQAEEFRIPVPPDDALAAAEKTIRDVFKDEYAIKTSSAQQKFAKKLLQQGGQTKDDAALKYVLLREATDLSLLSGDPETMLLALEQMCNYFAVQNLALRQSYLNRAEAKIVKPEDFKRLADGQLRLIQDALEIDAFDVAQAVGQAVVGVSKKSKDIALAARAEAFAKSVPEQKAAYEKVKKAEKELAANPEDPAANTVVGEYLCLTKGVWLKGVEHLAKGTDSPIKALAVKELAAPSEAGPLLELGDAWWDLADKEKAALRKRQMFVHASTFYEKALPQVEGLTKVRIQKRMSNPAAVPVNGTALGKVRREGLVAWWKLDEGKGLTIANAMGPGNVGTIAGGAEWVAGRLGTALKFNGSTSYVTFTTEGLPASNSPQTWSWWLYYTAVPTHGETAICLASNPATGGVQAGVRGNSGRVTLWKWSSEDIVSAPVILAAWTHYAYVYDGSKHTLYANGKQVAQSMVVAPASAVGRCEFGRYWGSSTEPFSGTLDDVRIYKRILTEREIESLASGSE